MIPCFIPASRSLARVFLLGCILPVCVLFVRTSLGLHLINILDLESEDISVKDLFDDEDVALGLRLEF